MYLSVIMMVMLLVGVVMVGVSMVMLSVRSNEGVDSSYECGFDSKFLVRRSFSYRFFLLAILFLIFDVEIVLMLSLPFIWVGGSELVLVWGFILILMGGLMNELKEGVLEWL